LLRGTDAASEVAIKTLARLLAAALVLSASIAAPAFADGRSKRAHVAAPTPPPLRIPPPTPEFVPPPIPVKAGPAAIVLSSGML
jgi:hypothetical protein